MRVTRLALTDFRSYANAEIDFASRVTTFVGPNGAGKTNVVEGLQFLSTLSSHRVASTVPLIRAGCERALVRATVERAGRTLAIEVTINAVGGNSARLNLSAARPREIAGILRTVIFSPDDLDMVKGEPAGRRRFLDELAVALSPKLAGDLADYDRVVRQRSTLLKSAKGRAADLSTLDVWDEKLVTLGAAITSARLDVTAAIRPAVAEAYEDVSAGGGTCAVRYAVAAAGEVDLELSDDRRGEIERILITALARERSREIDRGVCLVGPHRDDLDLTIGDLPARGYASHGESWSAALALRLGSYAMLTADGGPDSGADGEPVLILDDVFAELDAARREALARRVADARQVIVTAAVGADVPQALTGAVVGVENGRITTRG